MTMHTPDQHASEARAEWLERIGRLQGEVRVWAEGQGWSVREESREIREGRLGRYTAPVLHIKMPGAELYVEPVGLEIFGADGRIDLVGWPSLNRVRLVGRGGGTWQVVTESNVTLQEIWGEETFVRLAKELTAP